MIISCMMLLMLSLRPYNTKADVHISVSASGGCKIYFTDNYSPVTNGYASAQIHALGIAPPGTVSSSWTVSAGLTVYLGLESKTASKTVSGTSRYINVNIQLSVALSVNSRVDIISWDSMGTVKASWLVYNPPQTRSAPVPGWEVIVESDSDVTSGSSTCICKGG